MGIVKEATLKRFLLLIFFFLSLFGLTLIFNASTQNPDAGERFYLSFAVIALMIILLLMTSFTFMMLRDRQNNSAK